ncbi:MAG: serine/threonine-protein kinase, partial [Planctomycetia bacterium]
MADPRGSSVEQATPSASREESADRAFNTIDDSPTEIRGAPRDSDAGPVSIRLEPQPSPAVRRTYSPMGLPSTTLQREPPEAPAELVLGATLDHFELLDCIGVGGMGRVFRARDNLLDRLVALKVLSPDVGADPEMKREIRRRFEQEAKSAARLDDPHFARVYYFGQDKGLQYIAMEYVEGENLRRMIDRNGRLDFGVAVNLSLQIARGLVHAAACGVVHRDVKPSNIIITPGGLAKLVDMGLARNSFQSGPEGELTQAGVTLGTFDYISPEQAHDPRNVDVRSDIYSLGCTLFHALTGRPPFPDGTAMQKLLHHRFDAPPDPRRFVPDLPELVVLVVRKMMAKDPKQRYQTPGDLIHDLRALCRLLDVPLPDEDGYTNEATAAAGFWETHLYWMAPTAVLLTALAVVALVDRDVAPVLPPLPSVKPPTAAPPRATDAAAPRTAAVGEPPPRSTVVETPTEVMVGEGDDLRQAIADAPTGSTLTLTGSNYAVAPTFGDAEQPIGLTIAHKELEIRG